jgi:hypothetical protein
LNARPVIAVKSRPGWTLIGCVALFAAGAAFAQGPARGMLAPLASVQFLPDNDVKFWGRGGRN